LLRVQVRIILEVCVEFRQDLLHTTFQDFEIAVVQGLRRSLCDMLKRLRLELFLDVSKLLLDCLQPLFEIVDPSLKHPVLLTQPADQFDRCPSPLPQCIERSVQCVLI